MMDVSIAIFRKVYLETTQSERHYYGFFETGGYEEDSVAETLVALGYCNTIEDGLKALEDEKQEAYELIEQNFQEQTDDIDGQIHDEAIWDWDENHAISEAITT